jgi:hypothetical protein
MSEISDYNISIIMDELKGHGIGSRALDWRVYAAAINRDAAARLGRPGAWTPRDIEDKEFARYADLRNIPRYTESPAFAMWLVEVTQRAILAGHRPIGRHVDDREP